MEPMGTLNCRAEARRKEPTNSFALFCLCVCVCVCVCVWFFSLPFCCFFCCWCGGGGGGGRGKTAATAKQKTAVPPPTPKPEEPDPTPQPKTSTKPIKEQDPKLPAQTTLLAVEGTWHNDVSIQFLRWSACYTQNPKAGCPLTPKP